MENTITEQQADIIARDWVNDVLPLSIGKHHPWQRRWLMNELATLCIAETIKQKQGEFELLNRLSDAYNIVESISYHSMGEVSNKVLLSQDETILEQERINKEKRPVWYTHDPRNSMKKGVESESYFMCADKNSLNETIADYLTLSWLRHPFIDWVLVDMMVTNELCGFAEVLKENFALGGKNLFGYNGVYHNGNGNIDKMYKIYFIRLGIRFLTRILIPICAIWLSISFGYESTAITIGSIYGFLVFVYIVKKASGFISYSFNRITGRAASRAKQFILWEKMYEVWQRLRPPVLNPTLIRELMYKTTQEGAVWDSATWSIIDRTIAIDPAVWIIR